MEAIVAWASLMQRSDQLEANGSRWEKDMGRDRHKEEKFPERDCLARSKTLNESTQAHGEEVGPSVFQLVVSCG